jgi:hypothetical protein
MSNIYGLPQPLTGAETVSIHQTQNGQLALCTMPLSELVSYLTTTSFSQWIASLSTTAPTTSGVAWNNNGVISFS